MKICLHGKSILVQGDSSALRPGLGWVDFDLGVPPSCPAAFA